MERESTQENPEVQAAADKFIALKNIFITEVIDGKPTREVVEGILTEVKNTAVEALIKSGGHPHIMEALELEFVRPILGKVRPDSMHHGAFRNMIGDVATKLAERFSQKQ